MPKDDVVEKFKEMVLDMHRGIPNYRYHGYLEQLIPDKEIRNYFFKRGVFVKSKHKHNGQDQYFLGVEGINLANNYKIEKLTGETCKLTSRIKKLTLAVLFLTGLTVIIGILQNREFLLKLLGL